MIKKGLTINGKSVKLPIMDELTVKQYIEFIKTDMSLVNYLSLCLKVTYKEAFNMKLKNIKALNLRIGQLKDYTKTSVPKKLIINNELYFIKNIDLSTVGHRFMIEENAKKLKDEELFCFILAIGIVKDPMNIDDIKKMKRKLMKEPYINILPLGFFLAKRFLIGKNRGMNFSRILNLMINLKSFMNRPVLSN